MFFFLSENTVNHILASIKFQRNADIKRKETIPNEFVYLSRELNTFVKNIMCCVVVDLNGTVDVFYKIKTQ